MNIKGIEYEIVEEIGDYDCYDWHEGALLRRADGQLFFAEDSGCSCTSFGDGILSESDMTPVKSFFEAVEVAKESFSDEDVVAFAKRLLF